MSEQQNLKPQRGNVQKMLGAYLEAYGVLSTTKDFTPRNPMVNRTLSQLVEAASKSYTAEEINEVLTHKDVRARVRRMWGYLGRAEGEMETFHGARLDKRTIESFKYYENYQQLAAAEIAQWKQSSHFRVGENQSIALPGAGPLPLTAVVMHQQTGYRITCIDHNPFAVRTGLRFLAKCGLRHAISYHHADAAAYDYETHPAVLIASLVGDKHGVTRQIMKSSSTHEYAVRSAEGMHILLYPPVYSQLPGRYGFAFDRRTAPTPQIINTTLFATLPANRGEFSKGAETTGESRASRLSSLRSASGSNPDSLKL